MTIKNKRQATKVFAKAGLDIETSAMGRHQQRFRLDVQCSVLVLNFNNIFSNEHLYRAGQSMNSQPSQILERWASFHNDITINKNDKTIRFNDKDIYRDIYDTYLLLLQVLY